MYLPIYSPTRINLILRFNGKQVYKKEIDSVIMQLLNNIEKVKEFIATHTRFTKQFDSYEFKIIDEVITNPE